MTRIADNFSSLLDSGVDQLQLQPQPTEPSRTHRTVLVDDEPSVLPPEPAELPRRKRGRPPGAKGKVANPPVTVDDIAFLRAVLQGIDHKAAASHYLGHLGSPLERNAANLYPEILRKRLVASAHSLPEAREHIELLWPAGQPSPFAPTDVDPLDLGDEVQDVADPPPDGNTLFSWSTASAAEPESPRAPIEPSGPPSLEEFAARFDTDMFSEAELIELYQDEYERLPLVEVIVPTASAGGAAPAAAEALAADQRWVQEALKVPPAALEEDEDNPSPQARQALRLMQERLLALSWLADRLAIAPVRENPIHQWLRLSTGQTYAFGQQGVLTLGSLIDWIALTGRRWYVHIPRYGRERARRLEGWIWSSGLRASPGLRTPGEEIERLRQGFGGGALVARLAPTPGQLVPLSEFNWPAQHRGGAGGFRGSDRNTLEAHDDVEAVRAWFGTLSAHSPQTQRAYRGAIERLVLWAVTERHKALSALSTLDLQDFRAFLQNPPAHWVQKAPRLKTAHDWRPLRGPLKTASLQLSQAAVRALYKAWFLSGYITSDPCALLPAPKRKDAKLDVGRSFTEQDRQLIRTRLQALPESMGKRRLVAILVLLQTSGMRRNELAEATWAMIENMRIGDQQTQKQAIRIVGKGQRERVIPLLASVIELLERHRQDRLDLGDQGVLQYSQGQAPEQMPLIGVLNDHFATSRTPPGGPTMAHESPRAINVTGGLSAGRIYALVKRFFDDCAKHAGPEHSSFQKASTHWLRHTFGHQALQAAQGDLVVVKDLLGHADISTTTIYTKSELGGRAAVVEAIEPMV